MERGHAVKKNEPKIIDAEILDETSFTPKPGQKSRAVGTEEIASRAQLAEEAAEATAGVVDAAADIASMLDPEFAEKIRAHSKKLRAFGQAASQTVQVAAVTADKVQNTVLSAESALGRAATAFKKLSASLDVPRKGTLRRR